MKQVIVLKLEATPEQRQAMLQTVEAFNRGCDHVAAVAFQKRLPNKIALQPFVYGTLRADHGLSSQMAIRAISKAVEAYKRDKDTQPTFDPHGAMVYDERILSFRGVLPFTLLLPSAGLVMTGVLSVVLGFILASAFSAILVYTQELLPGRVGRLSGLFFGFAFGMAGIGAVVLGKWADTAGIVTVYRACSFLPAIGLPTAFLPDLRRPRPAPSATTTGDPDR